MLVWERMGRAGRSLIVIVVVAAALLLGLAPGRGRAQNLPPGFTIPSFTLPPFTQPTFPPKPTFPTITTTPPPTMPPPTTTPPPTMPPTSIPQHELPPVIQRQIEDLIDQLSQFGDDFSDAIAELEGLLHH